VRLKTTTAGHRTAGAGRASAEKGCCRSARGIPTGRTAEGIVRANRRAARRRVAARIRMGGSARPTRGRTAVTHTERVRNTHAIRVPCTCAARRVELTDLRAARRTVASWCCVQHDARCRRTTRLREAVPWGRQDNHKRGEKNSEPGDAARRLSRAMQGIDERSRKAKSRRRACLEARRNGRLCVAGKGFEHRKQIYAGRWSSIRERLSNTETWVCENHRSPRERQAKSSDFV
jgi:hypothetical protein